MSRVAKPTSMEWQDAWERAQQRADDLQVENRRLRDALEMAQGEAYLGTLAGDDTPDPLAACHNVIKVCLDALGDRHA